LTAQSKNVSAFAKATARQSSLSTTTRAKTGGKGIRTPDFQLAKLALYQLSYAPNPIADFRLPIADCKFRRSQTAATVSWVSAFLIRFFCTNKMPDVDLAIRNPALQSMCSKD
jgi:hypothetical protein